MVHAYSIRTKIYQNILQLAEKQVLLWQQRNIKNKFPEPYCWQVKMNIFNASALQIYLNIDPNISSVRYGHDYLKNFRVFGVLNNLMPIQKL